MLQTDSRSEPLHALAQRITSQPELPFCTPGLAILTRRADGSGERVFAGTDGARVPLDARTLFPLASASKLALGLAFLRLVDEGALAFDDPLSRYVPDASAARPDVTLRSLLCHTSGLPLDVDPDAAPLTPDLAWPEIAEACVRTPPRGAPWERVQYSNVAYGLVALVMQRVSGSGFTALLEDLVFAPLGVEAYVGRVPPRTPAVVVDIDSRHVGTELEPYNSEFWWRLGTPWAGIYSTADGLLAMLEAFTDAGPELVRPETRAAVRVDQTRGLAGGFATTDPFLGFNTSRAIAWPRCAWGMIVELRGDKRPHWSPPSASPESFGQIGASGCVAWHDPARGVSWVALAPRTTDGGWLLRHGPAIGNAVLRGAAAGGA
jgi:beta-lactamase class C